MKDGYEYRSHLHELRRTQNPSSQRPLRPLPSHRRRINSALQILDRLTLVDGTCVEMLVKNTVRNNNRSGVPGVDWVKSRAKWRATICFKRKRYYLGYFSSFEDAVKARRRAEDELVTPFLETMGVSREGAI